VNMFEIFRFSFEALKDRRLRSGLTILMVVIGAGLIVSLNGMSAGFQVFMTEQFSNLAPNVLMVTPAPVIQMGATQTNPVKLDAYTVNSIKPISGVKEVVPVVSRFAQIRSGTSTMGVMVLGVDQSKIQYIVPKLSVEEGNFLSPYDSVGMVVGYKVENPPGQTTPFVRLGQAVTMEYTHVETQGLELKSVTEKRSFVVKGVTGNVGTGGAIQFDTAVSVSLPAANSFFKAGGEYDAIMVVTKSPDLNEQVEGKIREIYGKDIGVTSPKAIVETIQTFISGFSMFIVGIAAVSLIVAAVGVITTLFTSVLERTREIGVLKALGFKNHSIMMLFLTEAVIVGIIGASVGIAIGMALGSFMIGFISMGPQPLNISPVYLANDLLFVWLFAVAISAVAGLYPAWRASKLDPVVALRKE